MRLRDIIELADVKPVIELDDAERDPDGILKSFVITQEVEAGLRSILERIDKTQGCGSFIKGNFGSGKSHFLSFFYLLLRNKSHPVINDYRNLKKIPLKLLKISLVRYPASKGLEEIILQSLNFREKVNDRQDVFTRLFDIPSVIIIDELSEFLRSKPQPSEFYEDIRFLQFLGEFSMRHPLWVIASLQEWIEETGHISSSIFNRIKDRYPLRINLTSSHIEDIIDQRLVIKKEGSTEIIKGIFDELRRFYPHLGLSFDRFRKTYPLHPFTSRFLTGLTGIFSQHRGVIEFVRKEVMKRLDEPVDSLITPDIIFDHFEDRVREIPEFSSFVRVAYDYYKNNLSLIFNNPLQREVALEVIKILILTELSPHEKRKTAKDMTEILLKKISTVTDRINYDYIKNGILEPLVAHQMYIMKDGETYFIDIAQDEGIRIKVRIKAICEKFSDRAYLFSEIANLISLPYLPLRDIRDGKRYRFNWQNSLRECIVLLSNGLTKDDIERFIDGVKKRVDGYFIILSAFANHGIQGFSLLFNKTLFPDIPPSILIWQPREVREDERIFIEEYVAKNILVNEFPSLKDNIKTSELIFRDTITKIYYEGRVFVANSNDGIDIRDIGYLPLERLLSHLFDAPLRELYPEHQRIMPRVDIYTTHHTLSLFNHLIKSGRITIEEAEKKGIVPYIKGLLEPLGIASKRTSSFTLHIDPMEEPVSSILELINQEHDLNKIRMRLRKSRWGLSDYQIDLILSSLIVSGYIVPYGRNEMIEFRDINQLSSGDVITLKPGKAIEPELLAVIPKGSFIWGELETAPTPSTIKTMWKEASQFIRRYRRLIDELLSLMDRYREYSIFKLIRIDTPTLNRISMFLHSTGLNLSPQEGIERFLIFLRENEDLEKDISYIERLYRFLNEEFQVINKYYLYLTHPSLKLDPAITHESILNLRDELILMIERYLKDLSQFDELRDKWTEFFDSYTSFYKDSHERFYSAPIFKLRKEIEKSNALKTLRKIGNIVSSITFENEWWEIKRRLDELPMRCENDLNQELFINPTCRCGFELNMKIPDVSIDIEGLCINGIRNFLKTIQLPENKEKIDSTITGLVISGKKEVSERLLKILSIDPEKLINQVIPLFNDDVLEEIENAFRGRWKVKVVILDELIERIKNRRFRYEEIERLIFEWLGDDRDSIIHIKTDSHANDLICEELSIYGVEGKKAQIELMRNEPFSEDKLMMVLDTIDLRRFDTSQLLGLLKRERNDYMKKRLRNEIFERLWNSGSIQDTDINRDETMGYIIKVIQLLRRAEGMRGVKVFTDIIAPASIILDSLSYSNINERYIDHKLLKRLQSSFESILKDYERRDDRFDGVINLEHLKESLRGNVVIIDALRFDLWLILREVITNEGWKVNDGVTRIDPPSITSSFREALGIVNDSGTINGRSYSLFRVAERDMGKRNLRRFLKESTEIKFLHLNFIDVKLHASSMDIFPLYEIIKKEFMTGIIPLFKELSSFFIISDHGFIDTKELKERYKHGGKSVWETVLPFGEIRI